MCLCEWPAPNDQEGDFKLPSRETRSVALLRVKVALSGSTLANEMTESLGKVGWAVT